MRSLAAALILEKNLLSDAGAWIVLLQIDITGLDTIRVCRNTENITWDGETWIAFPFELDLIGETAKNEVPSVVVRVGNASRAMQTYLEQGDGGIGATVVIRVVHSENLGEDAAIELTYEVTKTESTSKWVTFTLGAASPFNRRFPQKRMFRNFCRHKFKDENCQYAGEESTCDKTLADCALRNNTTNFGGFPSILSGGVYL